MAIPLKKHQDSKTNVCH